MDTMDGLVPSHFDASDAAAAAAAALAAPSATSTTAAASDSSAASATIGSTTTATTTDTAEAATAAAAAGLDDPGLSKNARKRLIKESQRETRKLHRKMERQRRVQNRADRAASTDGSAVAPLVLPPREAAAALKSSAAAAAAPPNAAPRSLDEHRAAAQAMWERFGKPRYVLAPMVNQSELAFRLLARRHGAGLTYTPMLHSRQFMSDEAYRLENFDEHASDRPLVVQFCGDDPHTLLAAARQVQSRCDAIDLNCGCPQGIARRGHYGAFLLDEPDLIVEIVKTLSAGLRVPVFVKMRVLPMADGSGVDADRTIAFAQRLEAAGASLLTVHGRTRVQKCACEADWATLAKIKASLGIPMLANGGVERPEDLERCLDLTGCDGVMTSEAALENPAILSGVPTSRAVMPQVARDYIALSRQHPPRVNAVLKAHFFKFLYMALEEHRDLRAALGSVLMTEDVYRVVESACEREEAKAKEMPHEMTARCDEEGAPWLTWYRRHRGASAAPADRYGGFVPSTVPEVKDASVECCAEAAS